MEGMKQPRKPADETTPSEGRWVREEDLLTAASSMNTIKGICFNLEGGLRLR